MSYYDTVEFEEEMTEEGRQEKADEIRQGMKEDGIPEALMYSTRVQLEMEYEALYGELIHVLSKLTNGEGLKLNRLLALEAELQKRLA